MGCRKYPSVANAGGKVRRSGRGFHAPRFTIAQRATQDISLDTIVLDKQIDGFSATEMRNQYRALGYGNRV